MYPPLAESMGINIQRNISKDVKEKKKNQEEENKNKNKNDY